MTVIIDLPDNNLIDCNELYNHIKKFIENNKNKDSQLEIDFEKANAEAKQDEIFSKMSKKEFIEYIKEKNIELEKCNESRKCEIMIIENLRSKLTEKDKEIEEGKNNKIKLDSLREKYNDLANKFNKQYNAIDYLENRNKFLEESNTKLSNDYNYLQRLYNGTKEACDRYKKEAQEYQYKLNNISNILN